MLENDTSDSAIAGIFPQKQPDGEWHPIAYYLKIIIDAELNYPIHNKEILAIIFSFQHWYMQLKGTPKPIQIVSDHKALKYFITTKALTAQQAYWADVLSQYNFLIIYRPGATNHANVFIKCEQDLND